MRVGTLWEPIGGAKLESNSIALFFVGTDSFTGSGDYLLELEHRGPNDRQLLATRFTNIYTHFPIVVITT
jgi:hypothetical protein